MDQDFAETHDIGVRVFIRRNAAAYGDEVSAPPKPVSARDQGGLLSKWGFVIRGVFLVYSLVHSLEYSIFLSDKRYLTIFSESILCGPRMYIYI